MFKISVIIFLKGLSNKFYGKFEKLDYGKSKIHFGIFSTHTALLYIQYLLKKMLLIFWYFGLLITSGSPSLSKQNDPPENLANLCVNPAVI